MLVLRLPILLLCFSGKSATAEHYKGGSESLILLPVAPSREGILPEGQADGQDRHQVYCSAFKIQGRTCLLPWQVIRG